MKAKDSPVQSQESLISGERNEAVTHHGGNWNTPWLIDRFCQFDPSHRTERI